ncbi:MAG: D-alanine--D-alanine ligase [Pseudomonadota bacterium]|nr:D-alanine--D-alanine ligase [Pseudomonadota bacterium]
MSKQHDPTLALRVAILAGGNSAEAQVSRNSAAQIEQALVDSGHKTQIIELNDQCVQALLTMQPDVVFPALHGPPGEDGTVQGMLEILRLPYVGSDVRGSALAMDKAIAKSVFFRQGLPVSEDYTVRPGDDLSAAAEAIQAQLGDRVALKPLNQGSAIGVQLLPNGGDIAAALQESIEYGSCLVEPYIEGREMTVGVLQLQDERLVHPVIEIHTPVGAWYDYEHRYTAGQSEHVLPASISEDLGHRLQAIAASAHQALGLRDLSRADFIVTREDEISLLEVNALPGMTPVSLYPEGAAAIGYPFKRLVHTLVAQEFQRGLL